MSDLRAELQKYWGHQEFRPKQGGNRAVPAGWAGRGGSDADGRG